MSINMKNDLLCIVLMSVASVVLTILISSYVYERTKSSYTKVGYNDGIIQAKLDMIDKIEAITDTAIPCNDLYTGDNFTAITFVEVKASSLYAVKYENGLLGFCLKK